MADKQEPWIRDPNFKKYSGTVFGLNKAGDTYRLDIGNERIKVSDSEFANVSECQIILPKESFEVLIGLLNRVNESSKKQTKK